MSDVLESNVAEIPEVSEEAQTASPEETLMQDITPKSDDVELGLEPDSGVVDGESTEASDTEAGNVTSVDEAESNTIQEEPTDESDDSDEVEEAYVPDEEKAPDEAAVIMDEFKIPELLLNATINAGYFEDHLWSFIKTGDLLGLSRYEFTTNVFAQYTLLDPYMSLFEFNHWLDNVRDDYRTWNEYFKERN